MWTTALCPHARAVSPASHLGSMGCEAPSNVHPSVPWPMLRRMVGARVLTRGINRAPAPAMFTLFAESSTTCLATSIATSRSPDVAEGIAPPAGSRQQQRCGEQRDRQPETAAAAGWSRVSSKPPARDESPGGLRRRPTVGVEDTRHHEGVPAPAHESAHEYAELVEAPVDDSRARLRRSRWCRAVVTTSSGVRSFPAVSTQASVAAYADLPPRRRPGIAPGRAVVGPLISVSDGTPRTR